MSGAELPPAGWFDNPENPAEFRYWDGSAWTDHRAPKSHHPAPAAAQRPLVPTTAGDTISRAWFIIRTTIWRMLATTVLYTIAALAGVALLLVGLGLSTEDGVSDFIFDNDLVRWDFNPLSLLAWAGALVASLAAVAIFLPTLMIVFEGARLERKVSLMTALELALGRFARTLGQGLLALLALAVVWAIGIGIVLLGTETGFPVAISILVVIAYVIFVLPILNPLTAAVALSPRGTNSTGFALRGGFRDWRTVAGAMYLAILVNFGVNIASGILGLIPILGVIILIAVTLLQNAFYFAVSMLLWHRLGGEIDPEITDAVEASPER